MCSKSAHKYNNPVVEALCYHASVYLPLGQQPQPHTQPHRLHATPFTSHRTAMQPRMHKTHVDTTKHDQVLDNFPVNATTCSFCKSISQCYHTSSCSPSTSTAHPMHTKLLAAVQHAQYQYSPQCKLANSAESCSYKFYLWISPNHATCQCSVSWNCNSSSHGARPNTDNPRASVLTNRLPESASSSMWA